ncbi:probable multidrug resistance-associated protein lethal(2)03659 [Coccinella septempunctata]|uniref:probable multidrug resistance-associated protein lethal(2)03659 n=1 Tax=Coccinella septempunctata TaxID=41139 RepID=UPI001D079CC3|nr:probable multidrug resistance-associated protein lethal(2)03659 [Coccinella septempunctata]
MNNAGYHKPKKENPYKNASFFERVTFLYMFPIFYRTYRKGFEEEDLFEVYDSHRSKLLGDRAEETWTKQHCHSKRYALHRTLIKLFAVESILGAIIKLVDELLLVTVVPVAIGKLVSYFEKNQTRISQTDACIYAAIICSTYLIVNLSFHPAMMIKMLVSMKMRICCSTMIYRKSLRLDRNALTKTTMGQIVNLLSNDVTKFEQGMDNIDYTIISPVQAIVGLYMLYSEIGIAAVFGVVFLLSFVPLQIYVGKRTSALRHKTALRTDERVKLMNELICGMQVIKMYCWEKPFAKLIALARRKEMSAIRVHALLMGMLYSFEMFLTRTAIFISLLGYVLLGNYISAEKVFLITSIYNTIRPTVTIMFSLACSNIAEINISLKRINNFLNLEEIEEEEMNANENKMTNGYKANISSDNMMELKDNKSSSVPKIVFKDLSAKWAADSNDDTLCDIDIELNSNQLVAVIGPVGSGKSSLVSVILKEIQITKGYSQINGTISYASQEPWLFHGSVRENILFGEPYDKRRYTEVVRVCCLKSDFLLLPYGDKTIVGDRGTGLSGGQRARINLARCIYRRADIYLLDDPLSAVDANVGRSLYQDCIKIFLHDKLRVLVTHQIQYLKSTDLIIVMNNGAIEKTGKFEELQNSDLNFGELLKSHAEEDEEKRVVSRRTSKQGSVLQSIEEIDEEPEMSKERLTEGNIKLSTYFNFIRAGGNLKVIIALVLFMLVTRCFEYGGDFFVRTWVNMEQNVKDTNGTLEIPRTTIIYTYSGITIGTITFSLIYCLSFVAFFTKASINLHNTVVERLIQGKMTFFDCNPAGRILNRFSKDMGIVDEYIPFILYDVVAIMVALIGTIVISVFVEVWLLIPCIFLIIILYICRMFYIVTSRNIKRIESITRSPVYSHTNTSVSGLTTIRAFKAQDLLKKEFDSIQDRHSCAWFLFLASNRCFGYWLDVICVSFVTLSTYILIFFSDNIYGGDVGLIFNQFVGLLIFLQWGMRQWSELENQMTSVERILEYTKIDSEPKRTASMNIPVEWPSQGRIEFKNIFLRYNTQDPPVLKNLNFLVEPMQKIGIVGRTGAGKSSIISALFQLYELEGGIIVDGLDITRMPLERIRTKISIIPQEPVLFSGTMRKNLDPFNEYSDDILWSALEQVELKEAIDDLGNGLNSQISEGGANFSVGQRQLVCLARALIRKNKILVLDEATANVDPQTDSLIQKTIRTKFSDCTVLTIAHRLHTIMDSDKILLMSNGSISDYDDPHHLLQKESGLLHDLVEATGNISSKNLRNIAKNVFMKSAT